MKSSLKKISNPFSAVMSSKLEFRLARGPGNKKESNEKSIFHESQPQLITFQVASENLEATVDVRSLKLQKTDKTIQDPCSKDEVISGRFFFPELPKAR